MAILTWNTIGIGVGVAYILYFLRQWIKGPKFNEQIDGHGRVAIVTGANSELGKEIVRELMQRNIRVYMLCQSLERGNQAKQALVKNYGCNPRQMLVMQVDLCNFQSIRAFVTDFIESHLNILVNNAEVMFRPFELTRDGWETTWQVNYLGHFMLTELLRPALEKSVAGGRVVNVSSLAQILARSPPNLQFVNNPIHFDDRFPAQTYARSKLAQVMHAIELTKRIRQKNPDSKVTINVCHPGSVCTDLLQHDLHGWNLVNSLFRPLLWFVQKNPNDAAQTPLFLALSKKIEGVSGKYFSDFVERSDLVNRFAHSPHLCGRLYNESLEACGLNDYCFRKR